MDHPPAALRHLVACDRCKRQYDASGRQPGARFRCGCGGVIEVTAPPVHDAAVVRCSACGAPREGRSASCVYCGSSFTLHERDLNTICPSCFVRVSDKARFCHHCAGAIHPENDAGEATESKCPACDGEVKLISRRLGDLSALECGRCAGLWVGAEVFRHLESSARERRLPEALAQVAEGPAAGGTGTQEGRLYRPCPACGKLMLRQNYGRRSGVVIDLCKSHGVWLDDRELAQILSWIRDGGLERSQRRDDELRKEEERRIRLESQRATGEWSFEQQVGLGRGATVGLGGSSLLGEIVFDVISDLFS